jgi:hypothetical protein
MGCGTDEAAVADTGSADGTVDGSDAADGSDGSDAPDGSDGSDGSITCDDTGADDEYAIVFGQRYRLPGQDDFDLYMMRPQQAYPVKKLTELSLKDDGATCKLGCEVDDLLRFIAVTIEQTPGTGGYTIQLGRFNSCLEAKVEKGTKYEGIAHLEFAGDFLYYSQQLPGCTGASCQFSITRVDLNNTADKKLIVPAFPPDDDDDWKRGDTIYGGFFRVSPDGESIVLLSPTIRSQRVYFWTKGALSEVDYLCEAPQGGSCIGAGSLYDDEDPVAISPDSKTVVLFSVSTAAMRIHKYSTENPADKSSSTLLNVLQLGSDYRQLACAAREEWQPVSVVGQPTFSRDGSQLLFIGQADCDDNQKPMSNIYRVDMTDVGDLTPIDEGELVNLTNNPEGDIPDNKVISTFTLSPDGKRILFSATPNLGQNYRPFTGTNDARPMSDTELYKMSVCGGEAEQITNDVAYAAFRPRTLPIPDASACGKVPLPVVE